MTERLTIDAALGGVHDRIGLYLCRAGLEDASGARRYYMELLRDGKFDKVSEVFGVSEDEVRIQFGHLSEPQR